jgi:TM2 domain-containing membrane protein YozV
MQSPAFAAILSAIIPGLGQIYNNETQKGIGIIIWTIICFFMHFTGHPVISFLGSFLNFSIWLYAVYDAYKTAKWGKRSW